MAVKAVPLADYAQTVGALAGAADCLRTEEVYAGLPLGEPMLVFCGFYGDRMNQALNAMRRTGLRIPYKGDADRGEPRLEACGAVCGASEGARGDDR